MPAKGTILPDHIGVNKYLLTFVGLPPITATKVGGIEDELEVVDLPDRTKATGGNRKVSEFDVEIPMHHLIEQAAMEKWLADSTGPFVKPGYKKNGTLILFSGTGIQFRTMSLIGCFPRKRATPDLDMEDEGTMATSTWTISVDDVLPV